MKRAFVMVLAGFGLASMLFALVAFVGAGSNGSDLVHVTFRENYGGQPGFIYVVYANGKTEEIITPIAGGKEWEQIVLENRKLLTKTLNGLLDASYEIKSHSTGVMVGGAYVESFVLIK